MKLTTDCPICGKPLKLKSELKLGTESIRTYQCGHTFAETDTASVPPETPEPFETDTRNYFSIGRRKSAYPFQREGIDFVFRSDFNCLIADPMGLGKTIQALLAARNAKDESGQPRFKSILTLVKSATQYQWFAESKEWFDNSLWSAFLIQGTRNFIPPGFQIYILSMDTLSRFTKTQVGLQKILDLNIDLVIVDECHSFKNPDSARSQALVSFLAEISQSEISRPLDLHCVSCDNHWQETITTKINLRHQLKSSRSVHYSKCPNCQTRISIGYALDESKEFRRKKGLILLSGTPIKNRADEYFIPLNLLRPDIFTDLQSFRRQWLDQDPETHKYNRIKKWRLDEFREMTKSFIIRREKSAVLDLPPFRRTFERISIESEQLKLAYNKALEDLRKTVDESGEDGPNYFEVEANLMSLRRITGMAKIQFAVEYVETFIETTDDEKIAIGVHHEGVRDGLFFALKQKGLNPLKLSGEDNALQKDRIVRTFSEDPERRILIVNMIAGGVGLNLQACNNTLVLERQWSAADEEQFEGRFHRNGQTRPVLAEYMFAEGTIDQYFMEMVEQKRQICGEALDGWDFKADRNALKELITATLSRRL